MSRKKRTRGRRARRPRTRRRTARRRLLIRLALAAVSLLVTASIVGGIVLRVQIAQRFDGRLWFDPSRIWSDVLVLAAGSPLEPDELTARLDRLGYARREGGATLASGQYRRGAERVDVRLRAFGDAAIEVPAASVRVRFDDGRVVTVADGEGRPLARAVVEPEPLATLYGPRQEDRSPLAIDDVPPAFLRAVLAAEDRRFAEHLGIDPFGVARAAAANVSSRRIVQGGSTITQQVVKNIWLSHRRSWWRKLREAALAIVLDASYDKRRILEVYVNEVYLGQRGPVAICGLQAAARFYFGRDAAQLTLAEHALLAGMIRSPGRYNPFRHPERALARRGEVLDALATLGWADAGAIEQARAAPLRLASGDLGYAAAPWAVDHVRAELERLDLLGREGLHVHTTIDTRWQSHAERALRDGLARLDERESARGAEGAVLVTDPRRGAILAVVGGRDYAASQFNRATMARRQPGSCFKPLVFAAGFERVASRGGRVLTTATLLDDSPIEVAAAGGVWRPENHDREFRGPVSVRETLELSLNVPTVRAAARVGYDEIAAVARRMGVSSAMERLPALALGVEEVTPIELITAYGTLADGGRRTDAWIVRAIATADGRELPVPRPTASRAISAQTAWLVTDVLQGVLERGTAAAVRGRLGLRGAAGKTGTTDDLRDAWFVGYTPEVAALVWIGHDDGRPTGLTGASGALPIWAELIGRAGEGRSPGFRRPEGLVTRRIDPRTGGLAARGCPEWVDEVFVAGSEPDRICPRHGGRMRRWFRRWFADDDGV